MTKQAWSLFLFTVFSWTVRSELSFEWLTNLEEARSIAATQEKPLLLVIRCEP